jgi:pimeloyl-ACP methyl ester carboxylesterase
VNPKIAAIETGQTILEVCKTWAVPPAPEAEAMPVSVSTPTLVLAGDYDPATPPEWGQRAAATLPAAHVSVFKGLSHAVFENLCGAKLVAAFLDNSASAVEPACAEHDLGVSFLDQQGHPLSR